MSRRRASTSTSQSGPSSGRGASREGSMDTGDALPPCPRVETVEELRRLGGDNALQPADVAVLRFRRCIMKTVITTYLTLCALARQLISAAGMDRLFNIVGSTNRFPQDVHAAHAALVERWSPSTHTFHFPDFEIGITPLDLTMILGIPFGSPIAGPVAYDQDFATTKVVTACFPHLNLRHVTDRGILHTALLGLVHRVRDAHEDELVFAHEQARAFFLWFIGYFLFPTSHPATPVGWLVCLIDLDRLGSYDWGMAMLACIYNALDACARRRQRNFNANWVVLEVITYINLSYFI